MMIMWRSPPTIVLPQKGYNHPFHVFLQHHCVLSSHLLTNTYLRFLLHGREARCACLFVQLDESFPSKIWSPEKSVGTFRHQNMSHTPALQKQASVTGLALSQQKQICLSNICAQPETAQNRSQKISVSSVEWLKTSNLGAYLLWKETQ